MTQCSAMLYHSVQKEQFMFKIALIKIKKKMWYVVNQTTLNNRPNDI